MKYFINGKEFQFTEDNSIVIVFKDDYERLKFAEHLRSYYEPQKGRRIYGVFPDDMPQEKISSVLQKIKDTFEEEQGEA